QASSCVYCLARLEKEFNLNRLGSTVYYTFHIKHRAFIQPHNSSSSHNNHHKPSTWFTQLSSTTSNHIHNHYAFSRSKLVGSPLHPPTSHQPRRRLPLPLLLQQSRRRARLPKVVSRLRSQHSRSFEARQPPWPHQLSIVHSC
ncbi:uncharacterized protein TRIVIDRAFT_215329, partial [Trichoderma virens Gv29-8]